jgi:peroxiredoxin
MRCALMIILGTSSLPVWGAENYTLLFEGKSHSVSMATADKEVWIAGTDLPASTGFELKPEGFCSRERCVPVPKEATWIKRDGGTPQIELTGFARHVAMPIVVDHERKVIGLGQSVEDRSTLIERGDAPDFELPDRTGKMVRLSSFRGKKVLLLTWASWCGCSADLPLWQKVYERLKDKNFELIAVAEDTAGEKAAGKFYDRAHATYTTLIDVDHRVTELYQMVNVPSGVWIDEQGKLARPPEVAYTPGFRLFGRQVGDERYVPAMEDWIERGSASRFVSSKEDLRSALAPESIEKRTADVEFKVGAYLFKAGDPTGATLHWQEAQKLDPGNWNYHRQEWSFDSKKAVTLWMKKVQSLDGKPYYPPIAFPEN